MRDEEGRPMQRNKTVPSAVEGAAATEYVFLLVLIALVVVAGVVVYGTVLGGAFEDGAARVDSETSA